MALQPADFDPTDPQQQVRRRLMTRLGGPDPMAPPNDAAPLPSADFGQTQPIALPDAIPGVPGSTPGVIPSVEPPVRQSPAIDYAPETPKITAGPVATAPLTPTNDPSDAPPNRGPVDPPAVTNNWHPPAGYEGDQFTGKAYSGVQGFDLGKIQDPTHQNAKYTAALRTFSQAITGLDPNTDVPRALAYIQNNGFPDAKMVGDRIDFGDGNGPIDVTIDSGKGGWWFQNGPDRFGGGAPASAAAPDAGSVYTPTALPGAQTMNTGAVSPGAIHPGTGSTESEWAISKVLSGEWTQQQADAYLGHASGGGGGGTGGGGAGDFLTKAREELMRRITEAGQPVDENAAGISGAVSAARDESTRASEQERTALAERLYAQGGGGLNSNALTQQIQQSGETNARNLSSLRSGMIVKEYARKQQQLTSMLNMALASGDAEMARDTQMKLAELSARVQREGLGVDLAKFLAALNQQSVLAGLS